MMTITYIIIFVYSKRVTHRQFETGCPQSGGWREGNSAGEEHGGGSMAVSVGLFLKFISFIL